MPQRLAQHLIARGLLPARMVDEALKRMQQRGGTLDTALLELGAISEAGMLQAVSDVSNVRLVNLADFEPNTDAGPLMPAKMARQLNVVPLSIDGNALHVACAYPIPQAQLKDLGFLLGRKIELWVALECRVRDWQSTLYKLPLDARYTRLLVGLDPSRATPPAPLEDDDGQTSSGADDDSLSTDVLERLARGIVEEPVLLDRPKTRRAAAGVEMPKPSAPSSPGATGRKPKAQIVELGDEDVEESRTSVLEPIAYEAFARSEEGRDVTNPGMVLGEHENTRVLDVRGYGNFAREVSSRPAAVAAQPSAPVPPPPRIAGPKPPEPRPQAQSEALGRISFPGGVLPPRKPTGEVPIPLAPPRPTAASLVKPAGAPRPAVEARRPDALQPLATSTLEDPDLDFSDVSAVLKGPTAKIDVPPAPPEVRPDVRPSRPSTSSLPSARPTAKRAPAPPVTRAPAPTPPTTAPIETPAPVMNFEVEPEAPLLDGELAAPEDQIFLDPPPKPAAPTPPPAPTPPADASDAVGGMTPMAPMLSSHQPLPAPAPSLPNVPSGPILAAPPGLQGSNALEWSLAQARASLRAASNDREQLISVVLEYGRRTFEYVSAFAVMRGAAVGWDGRGEVDVAALRQVAIPLDAARDRKSVV